VSRPITERGLKIAATMLGHTPDEYRAHLEAGDAWCSGHKQFEPRDAFHVHPTRWNGLQQFCKRTRAEYDRTRTHVNHGRIFHAGPAYSRSAS
jgi:hypothetical protein